MKLHRFKQAALASLALVAFAATAPGQTVTGLSDLNYWGTGANHAGFVISWNDGKTTSTIAWGFSWDGTKTVFDLFKALANGDTNLFARIDSSTQYGPGIFGLGYDTNHNGNFSVTGAQNTLGDPTAPIFSAGISDMNIDPDKTEAPLSSEGAGPGEAADHYVEAWNDNGFWEFFTGGADASYPVTWTSSLTGIGSTNLVNNGWYALSITNPDYSSNLPGTAVAAVPEPTTIALLVLGGIAVLFWRRKIRHA